MIGSGILLALTVTITLGWLYVETTDISGWAEAGPNAHDDETDPDL